jgi:hypothetical protein
MIVFFGKIVIKHAEVGGKSTEWLKIFQALLQVP